MTTASSPSSARNSSSAVYTARLEVCPSTRMCDERRIGRPSRRKKMLRSPPMPVLARRIECGRQAVELGPECVGDLEIVALMADDVDESEIARIAEIAVRRAHADGFAALPVQIAPVTPQRRGCDDAQRIGAGKLLPIA